MNNTDKKIIIAIDGFSSSGKSTMAKELARRIGYRYIDSGAMYRAVTLYALEHGMILADGSVDTAALTAALDDIHIDFLPCADGQHTLLNGRDVEKEIRSLRVSSSVSPVAVIPAVRHALVAQQQAFGNERGIVMDGRDIGTTVFPDAELKIYVNAPAETRARRRWLELQANGDTTSTYEDVLENVVSRDHIDMTREESPLRRADDAIDLDNSDMSIEEQNEWLIKQFNRVTGK
ncbi:MAG: cytidylate kinase [Bacteroidales bacterium 52_46]|nr:MAG: cytidylate kinase [Bacteroidales bacterium 52_46]